MYSISVNQKTKQLIADQINLHFIPQGTNAFLGGVHAQYAQEKKKKKKDSPTISELCHQNKAPIQ